MTPSQIKNTCFVLFFIFIFFVELALFAILHTHTFYPLLCFFILLTNKNSSTRVLVSAIFLISLISYLDYNIFGWSLIYIIPIIILAKYFNKQLHIKFIIPYVLLIIGLIIKIVFEYYLLSIHILFQQNLYMLFYNTTLLFCCISIYNFFNNKLQLSSEINNF